MLSLPSPKTALKFGAAWVASNVAWSLFSSAAGALASAILKAGGVLDNTYGLVAVGLLIAALVASLPAVVRWLRRRRLQDPTHRETDAHGSHGGQGGRGGGPHPGAGGQGGGARREPLKDDSTVVRARNSKNIKANENVGYNTNSAVDAEGVDGLEAERNRVVRPTREDPEADGKG